MIAVSDKILVSESILTEYFACDVQACRGICCVEGDSGAPLAQEECTYLETEWPRYIPYMQNTGVRAVEKLGPWTLDIDCDTVTPLIEGKECAYAFFQDRNCLCAIERAHNQGVSSFKARFVLALSHTGSKLADGAIGLNYHKWYLCSAARELGAKKKIRVFEFVKEPLIHCFGPDVYQAIRQAADNPG